MGLPRRLARGCDRGARRFYDLAIWIRVAAELYLVAVVVRDILRPAHDPVRTETVAEVRVPALS